MVEDKYIGLALAVSSSLAIGTSFILTKKVGSYARVHHRAPAQMRTVGSQPSRRGIRVLTSDGELHIPQESNMVGGDVNM